MLNVNICDVKVRVKFTPYVYIGTVHSILHVHLFIFDPNVF